MNPTSSAYEITKNEFDKLSKLVYTEIGIHLADHKMMLVRSRLSKRLRVLGLSTFDAYLKHLEQDNSGEEMIMLINEISTNVTSFFREPSQWDFLEKELKRYEKEKKRTLRIWSSACSSGQEPYTIAIFLLSTLANPREWDIKILASDISQNILEKAMAGIYSSQEIGALPKSMLVKFFDKKVLNKRGENETFYEIKPFVKEMVTFRSFNLVYGSYAKIPPKFDMIFCRNVMIYFDKETKNSVVQKLLSKILKEGYFFIGHSESLVSMKDQSLKLVQPSIYQKH